MRTDQYALTALDTKLFVPDRDLESDVALLPLRGGVGEGAIHRERANGQIVAFAGDNLRRYLRTKSGAAAGTGGRISNCDVSVPGTGT